MYVANAKYTIKTNIINKW